MSHTDIEIAKAICGYCAASLAAIVLAVTLGFAQANDDAAAATLKAQQRAIAQTGAAK